MKMFQAISTKISNMFTRGDNAPTGRGISDVNPMTWMNHYLQVSADRVQCHRDMHRMDKNDEIVKFSLNTIASRALGLEDTTLDAFSVDVQPEEQADGTTISDSVVTQANWEIKQLNKRLGIQSEAWQIVRGFVKFGDEIREIVVDPATLDITTIKKLPEHTIVPNVDKMGNRAPGYTQIVDAVAGESKPIVFAEWEIVQFSFGEIDGYKGTPLLDCARKNWKRLNLAEDSTALARLIRAFVKFVHRVPVSSSWSATQQQATIKDYKTKITQLKVMNQDPTSYENEDWPQTVSSDFFITDDGSKRGGVDMLDPANTQLQNITDIEHFMNRLITATHIPKRYFPFEGSTPKLSEGGGNSEDKNFACLLVLCQNVLKQGLATLYDRQLAMKGIDPSQVRYVFRMADLNTVDQLRMAETELALAKTLDLILAKFPGMGEKMDVVLREYTRMSDASLAAMKDIKYVPPVESTTAPATDNRVQLPGTGTGAGRSKV